MNGSSSGWASPLALLVVQDPPPILEYFVDEFRKQYRGAVVDSAGTVKAATETITATANRSLHYKVAVLDLHLPANEGEPPSVGHNFELVGYLSKLGAADVIICTTPAQGKALDPVRQQLWAVEDQHPAFGRPIRQEIVQEVPGWAEKLTERVAGVIHGDRIEAQFLRLFGQRPRVAGSAYRRSVSGPALDLTLELDLLKADIACHWPILNDKMRELIQKEFEVQVDEDEIFVCLR